MRYNPDKTLLVMEDWKITHKSTKTEFTHLFKTPYQGIKDDCYQLKN